MSPLSLGITSDMAKQSPCTRCGKIFEQATSIGTSTSEPARKMKPGDATVCIRCGHVMSIDDDGQMRDLTHDEAVEFASDSELMLLQAMIRSRFNEPGHE